mmetsp:Transcript_4103/g.12414  ORF Transcript_4103/g.12414 Transcript_4103/m.12414 type:complete len:136 (+) Transcript_4103:95-502(+)
MKHLARAGAALLAVVGAVTVRGARGLRTGSAAEAASGAVVTPAEESRLPPGYGVCLQFVQDRVDRGISGKRLVQDVAATCEPAVKSGAAMAPFKRACGEVQQVAASFVTSGAGAPVDVQALCKLVMRTFHSFAPA